MILAAFLLGSCSNNELLTEHQAEIPVKFNVSTLNVGTQPMSRVVESGNQLSDVVNKIVYYIFDESLKRVKNGVSSFTPGEEEAPNNFSSIEISLLPGKYSIVFYALGKGNGTCSFVDNSIYNYDSYFAYRDKEVFHHESEITITTATKSHEITLNRKSALLKIDITDDITPEVSKVTYSFSDSYRWYPKNSSTYRNTYTYEAAMNETKLDPFEYYFSFPGALVSSSVAISINIYDSNNSLIGEKKVTAPILENQRTTISGELFSTLGNKEFSISINDIWSKDNNIEL